MDTPRPFVLPRMRIDPRERHLGDIDAAIALVRDGTAVRVRILAQPDADAIAAFGLAHAQAAGVDFIADRDASGLTLTIGPRRAATLTR
jgi:hypothetical protein